MEGMWRNFFFLRWKQDWGQYVCILVSAGKKKDILSKGTLLALKNLWEFSPVLTTTNLHKHYQLWRNNSRGHWGKIKYKQHIPIKYVQSSRHLSLEEVVQVEFKSNIFFQVPGLEVANFWPWEIWLNNKYLLNASFGKCLKCRREKMY